jgi:predicted regulator of Ras-like GTPase activity (Roadblock/LC7/MglB family)
VILSPDGLALGSSPGLAKADADQLAALSAGAASLASNAGEKFGGGEVTQTIFELDRLLLFITPAARGTCVALLAESSADAGQVAYEMSVLVKRVGEHMAANPRFPVPGVV